MFKRPAPLKRVGLALGGQTKHDGCCTPPAEDSAHQATRWSNSKSRFGCLRRSQSGIGPRSSSQLGDLRPGAIGVGRGDSPMWVRIRSTGAASVTKVMMRMSAPQLRQVTGMDSNSRASSMAQR